MEADADRTFWSRAEVDEGAGREPAKLDERDCIVTSWLSFFGVVGPLIERAPLPIL